jgi:hypothetical protein
LKELRKRVDRIEALMEGGFEDGGVTSKRKRGDLGDEKVPKEEKKSSPKLCRVGKHTGYIFKGGGGCTHVR